jgi:hypothetical protein
MPLDVKARSSFAFAAGFESASSRDMQRLSARGAYAQVGDGGRNTGDQTVPPQENSQ